jgi:DNA-binding MarR family transcriptional regulator
MGVSVSTISIGMDRLERDGWVRRDPSPDDGRVVHLRLTEAGERVREASSVLDPAEVEAMLALLPDTERAAALAGLERLAAAADELVRRGRATTRKEGAA